MAGKGFAPLQPAKFPPHYFVELSQYWPPGFRDPSRFRDEAHAGTRRQIAAYIRKYRMHPLTTEGWEGIHPDHRRVQLYVEQHPQLVVPRDAGGVMEKGKEVWYLDENEVHRATDFVVLTERRLVVVEYSWANGLPSTNAGRRRSNAEKMGGSAHRYRTEFGITPVCIYATVHQAEPGGRLIDLGPLGDIDPDQEHLPRMVPEPVTRKPKPVRREPQRPQPTVVEYPADGEDADSAVWEENRF